MLVAPIWTNEHAETLEPDEAVGSPQIRRAQAVPGRGALDASEVLPDPC